MKYKDLIQFEPVEEIIVLKSADDKEKAKELVKTYIMNDNMAERLKESIIAQLQMENVVNNKGVFLVGNYGTGKSHLMSVISAVANDKEMTTYLTNEKFIEYVKPIEGKFEVLRIEIGSTKMSLRNIILNKIKDDFIRRGLDFDIPDEDEIINNKDTLLEIMNIFAGKYGVEKGYLIVVDEVLDYLGSRTEHELRRDLGFLREVGEVVKSSRLRIILGMQERLFENPKFSFVTETLNRIKDRFEQMIIKKEEMAYVVSERILKKDNEQRAIIREHLMKFTSYYTNMNERMDEFVDLFPIHPAYIDVFEKIYLIENRHILKNISNIVSRIMEEDIDEDSPGIFSFDSYWPYIKEDRSYISDPNVGQVVEKSGLLEDIINRSFGRPAYKSMAIKIIYGLSIHRLTTGDITIQAGLTAENLKDDLGLFIKGLPDKSSDTLQSMVQAVLKEIIKTVSGQFIDFNEDNGQYYLNIAKDIDYDEKITQKASLLEDYELNRYYYQIINTCMSWDSITYVPGFNIYEHTLNWESRNIFRNGYMFFGTPDDRPTAQPPRDYYIFFIPPYEDEYKNKSTKEDEVFFYFKRHEEFDNTLKLYAAASEMRLLAEEKNKAAYGSKINKYEKNLSIIVNENKNAIFEIKYINEVKKPMEIMGKYYDKNNLFKESVDLISSLLLDGYFNKKYPYMPKFSSKITLKNQAEYLRGAIDYYSGKKSPMGRDFLEAFNLIKEDRVNIDESIYAKYYKDLVSLKSGNEVINFLDIYEEREDGYYYDKKFGISSEHLSPVFLGLVYLGIINMSTSSGMITAAELENTKKYFSTDIYKFKYIEKPRDISVSELNHMLNILEIPIGLVVNPKTRDEAAKRMCQEAMKITNSAAMYRSQIDNEFILWDEDMIASVMKEEYKKVLDEVRNTFGNFSSKYNTGGKLNNFNLTKEEIDRLKEGIDLIMYLDSLKEFKIAVQEDVLYLQQIEVVSKFKNEISDIKKQYIDIKNNLMESLDYETSIYEFKNIVKGIKEKYINDYITEHNKHRLNHSQTVKRKEIRSSKICKNLDRLADFPILPGYKYKEIMSDLDSMEVCFDITPAKLEHNPICNNCRYHLDNKEPIISDRIDSAENKLEQLYLEWEKILVDTLDDPTLSNQLKYLTEEESMEIDSFLSSHKLPEEIGINFIEAIKSLLDGFSPVIIEESYLISEIEKLGPINPVEFKEKINGIIDGITGGKEDSNIRIVLKREDKNGERV